jgi:hypothetical protein
MGIKEEIIEALEALGPQIDRGKALLELDESASAIARSLKEPMGLSLIEYISKDLKYGKHPIYSMNKFLDKLEFNTIIEHYFHNEAQTILNFLLKLYHQLWISQKVEPKNFFEVLKNLERSKAVTSNRVAVICLGCYSTSMKEEVSKCSNCGGKDLLEIFELSIAEPAKDVLKNGQYLEVYVKECMDKSGIEPIGWNSEGDGKKVYTSINYQVEGEPIDIDVLGISQPIAVLLCEAKTSEKITMNEIRRVENLFDRLIKKINDFTGKTILCLKLFIITGEFDRNISAGAYKRKGWELIDKNKIPALAEEFRRIRGEI